MDLHATLKRIDEKGWVRVSVSEPLQTNEEMQRAVDALPKGYWDFASVDTKEWTHGYHAYPAMMIPQVARSLIQFVCDRHPDIRTLFDPFMGSGTSLVEGILAGLAVTGSDLNPLSRLLARAKTMAWEPEVLHRTAAVLTRQVSGLHVDERDWPDFKNLTFWFKPAVINDLVRLKRVIQEGVPDSQKPFFWVAFSDTVRWVSNSRNAEFKLYRLDDRRLESWNPDTLGVFDKTLERNLRGNARFYERPRTRADIQAFDARQLGFEEGVFDLMVTSPPYGDSRTTVAYGQFSRLSLEWLDLAEPVDPLPRHLDQAMLGGKPQQGGGRELASPVLTRALTDIGDRDPVRAREVWTFYQDLDRSLVELARVLRPGGFQCWVVGNRTVKGVQLATDRIIMELSEPYGLEPQAVFSRSIPAKRMPKENSPSNETGKKGSTMNGEQIFILRKRGS